MSELYHLINMLYCMVMLGDWNFCVRVVATEITVSYLRDQYPDWVEMLANGNQADWDAVIETVKTDIEVSGVTYPLMEEFHVSQVVN